jgi:hypothetical protein
MIVTTLLIYSATIVPYRIALHDEEEFSWIVVDMIIDVLFFMDFVIN